MQRRYTPRPPCPQDFAKPFGELAAAIVERIKKQRESRA
jgi:hypothetical protein